MSISARALGGAAIMASLVAHGAWADPPPVPRKPAHADPDDPLRHPGIFSLGPRTQLGAASPQARGATPPPQAIDLDIVVTNRAAPRNEEVPFPTGGADRVGRDFSAPAADPQDVYGGTRSVGTYGCRAGSICSATGGGGGALLRNLFGD